jgi:hypothetical protein
VFVFEALVEKMSEGEGILCMDFEKAYDRVPHEYSFKVLTDNSIPPPIVNCLSTTYSRATSAVVVNGRAIALLEGLCSSQP